jgi:plasmid stability protein
MAQVLVRDLKAEVVARLKARAKHRGRSLQTELKEILEQASRQSALDARSVALRIRRQLAGRRHSDSAELLAEDRVR